MLSLNSTPEEFRGKTVYDRRKILGPYFLSQNKGWGLLCRPLHQ